MPQAPEPSVEQFERAVTRVGAHVDGAAWRSSSSRVAPVTLAGRSAFLKVTNEPEELSGARALREWDGHGAVRLIERDADAIVMERAGATMRSVIASDDAATMQMCRVTARLHGHVAEDLGAFPSLADWFRSLFTDSAPRFDRARALAHALLDRCPQPVLLHGDLHSENVLDSPRGWLAIDPKGIAGAREFDYCNVFTNWTLHEAVTRFDARLRIVSAEATIDPPDLLRWIGAWSALSAVWLLEDGDEKSADLPLAIMGLAVHRLQRATRPGTSSRPG